MTVNPPNLLTLGRIVMAPLMVLLLVTDDRGALPAAAAVFVVAAVTDVADGHLARSRNMITAFGRVADPVADKLLVGSALVALVAVDRLALWIAVVIVVREAGVTLLRWHARGVGIDIAVSGLGKAKTGVQMITIPMLMLVPDPSAAWVGGVLVLMVAVTAASGLAYAVGYVRASAGGGAVVATR